MHIYTLPEKITFTLPFGDNSGNKYEVSYTAGKSDIQIKDVANSLFLDIADVDWLIEALRDAKTIANESLKIKTKSS